MGEVYRARDTKLGRDVALKTLPAVGGPRSRAAGALRPRGQDARDPQPPPHRANLRLRAIGGHSALVMELVEGDDLSARIAQGPMPLEDALPIARQVAEALEAAHERGIIHRDLKPANIKVRPDGAVKVLDFGLAKAMEPRSAGGDGEASPTLSPTITSPAMTMRGMILGTAAYMSPEQAKGKPVDVRSDIWAFGCVAYEMLAGRRAFEGEDVSRYAGRDSPERARVGTAAGAALRGADAPPPVSGARLAPAHRVDVHGALRARQCGCVVTGERHRRAARGRGSDARRCCGGAGAPPSLGPWWHPATRAGRHGCRCGVCRIHP